MANDMSPIEGTNLFDITRFFDGRVRAYGLFENRYGRVRRQFTVTLDGAWQGNVFVVDEHFRYDDGDTEVRQWRITKGERGQFTATCDDCIGIAQGTSTQHSWRMVYDFRLRLKNRAITVSFDDRVHRVDQHLAINRATVRKWGLRIGEAFIVFERTAERMVTEPTYYRERSAVLYARP